MKISYLLFVFFFDLNGGFFMHKKHLFYLKKKKTKNLFAAPSDLDHTRSCPRRPSRHARYGRW